MVRFGGIYPSQSFGMKFVPWIVSLLPLSVFSAQPRCRCLYGDDCWPNESDFSQLSSQLSHPLIYPVPPESACYPPSNPSGNCTDVLTNTYNGNWRANQSGSMQSPNFETFVFSNGTIGACYLNTSLGFPCEQGSVPPVGVDAYTVGDVQAAVKFAAEHDLRLVVKNTGHDYLGRSSARDSFLIWTHHLKNITYNETFVPRGAPSNVTYKAITLGSGVQWHEAYDAAQLHQRFVVGGLAAGGSVGAAGGWVLGGGHSAFAPRYGLGVDNVLQFEIVTASGSFLTVNAYSYPDLFWALRGGGGGTFGVLTSVTYVTHDPFPLTGIFLSTNFTSPDVAKTVLTEYYRIHPNISDAGWGGYSYLSNQSLQAVFVAPNISSEETNATIDPFFAFVQSASQDTVAFTSPFDSFYTWYQTLFATGDPVGTNVELSSRLIPRALFESEPEKIADTVLALQGDSVQSHLIAGGAVSRVNPDSTGLNPAWRNALTEVISVGVWAEGTNITVIREVENVLKEDLQLFENLAPGSGAYFNEASLYEKDFQSVFFGDHYQGLEAIKDRYDPSGLFIVAEGVGSERWDASLNCLQ